MKKKIIDTINGETRPSTDMIVSIDLFFCIPISRQPFYRWTHHISVPKVYTKRQNKTKRREKKSPVLSSLTVFNIVFVSCLLLKEHALFAYRVWKSNEALRIDRFFLHPIHQIFIALIKNVLTNIAHALDFLSLTIFGKSLANPWQITLKGVGYGKSAI